MLPPISRSQSNLALCPPLQSESSLSFRVKIKKGSLQQAHKSTSRIPLAIVDPEKEKARLRRLAEKNRKLDYQFKIVLP
jgi:hypothetical protein